MNRRHFIASLGALALTPYIPTQGNTSIIRVDGPHREEHLNGIIEQTVSVTVQGDSLDMRTTLSVLDTFKPPVPVGFKRISWGCNEVTDYPNSTTSFHLRTTDRKLVDT